jgi:hypothetical protein
MRPNPPVYPDCPFGFCLEIGNEMVPAKILAGIWLEDDPLVPALAALHRFDPIYSGR